MRNSIGADSYVADEIITAHSGARVLVGNTDAEGRYDRQNRVMGFF